MGKFCVYCWYAAYTHVQKATIILSVRFVISCLWLCAYRQRCFQAFHAVMAVLLRLAVMTISWSTFKHKRSRYRYPRCDCTLPLTNVKSKKNIRAWFGNFIVILTVIAIITICAWVRVWNIVRSDCHGTIRLHHHHLFGSPLVYNGPYTLTAFFRYLLLNFVFSFNSLLFIHPLTYLWLII